MARLGRHANDVRDLSRYRENERRGPYLDRTDFVEELRTGLPGVGSSTLKALRDLAAGQHWALSGARGEFAAGTGAAMRIAPLAFFGEAREPAFSRVIRAIASITHRSDEAMVEGVLMEEVGLVDEVLDAK